MRRRKLAWVLVGFLGVPAVVLVGIAVFLALSRHDYLLATKLRKTVRIDTSDRLYDWRVAEISKPDEVASIVSLACSILEPLDGTPAGSHFGYDRRAHFVLESGEQVVFLFVETQRDPYGDGEYPPTVIVPGKQPRAYRVSESPSLKDQLHGGWETPVLGELRRGNDVFKLYFRTPGNLIVDPIVRDAPIRFEAIGRDGQVRLYRSGGDFKPEHVASIRVTLDGKVTDFPLPSMRFHDPPPKPEK